MLVRDVITRLKNPNRPIRESKNFRSGQVNNLVHCGKNE